MALQTADSKDFFLPKFAAFISCFHHEDAKVAKKFKIERLVARAVSRVRQQGPLVNATFCDILTMVSLQFITRQNVKTMYCL